MAAEGALSFSVASVVEDVLQQHGVRSRELDLDSRRAEEAGIALFMIFFQRSFLYVCKFGRPNGWSFIKFEFFLGTSLSCVLSAIGLLCCDLGGNSRCEEVLPFFVEGELLSDSVCLRKAELLTKYSILNFGFLNS